MRLAGDSGARAHGACGQDDGGADTRTGRTTPEGEHCTAELPNGDCLIGGRRARASSLGALHPMRQQLAQRYSRRVVRNTMLRAMVITRYTFESGLVGRDPTVGVEAGPKYRAGDATEHVGAEQVPTRAEALTILTSAPAVYRAAIALGLAGLRIGKPGTRG
jgi:hypothetical protein